jgi:hypothetical protein
MKYLNPAKPASSTRKYLFTSIIVVVSILIFLFVSGYKFSFTAKGQETKPVVDSIKTELPVAPAPVKGNSDLKAFELYQQKMNHVINGDSSGKWTVNETAPLTGAILPYKRVIAYYGNLYSKQMGILGELPKAEVLEKLKGEVAAWKQADSTMDVQPALHYIAVTAQNLPGKGSKYRLRMPFSQIDSVLEMAKKIDAIVFIDIQVGLSDLQSEVPEFKEYLKLPNVHLGIDPEFSMKGGQRPGKVIGEFNANDINYAAEYMASIVKENNLPPKMLIVHRFTQGMVKQYKEIKTRPEVQIVMHMDGWGIPAKKINTYKQFIYKEPVEFTGFKIFYKNDTKNNGRLLTPQELLKLQPQPMYIQYQ